jgi:NAD(P)-dependent dehydrogenase (short-subunit alcohol dehydrogenase family)
VGREARVAWVTGGGRGIGRATSLALARAGHAVAVSARTQTELDETVRLCAKQKAKAVAEVCDVTDDDAVRRSYARISKALGPPLILVNGAGLARSAAFLKTDAALMESLWRLNVLGTFHPTQAALPKMLEAGWGRIVNVASVAGKTGAPYIAAYAASKHAVLGLTRSLAAEVAPKGVTVNAVCPGYVDTKMTDDNVRVIVEKTGLTREAALDRLRAMSPQNRLMTPEEVAATIVHLCGEDARGINGQSVTIDGGALPW